MTTPLVLLSELEEVLPRQAASAEGDAERRTLILEMTEMLQTMCDRRFDEYIESRDYTARRMSHELGGDLLSARELQLDRELQTLTALSIDGTSITPAQVRLMPLNGAYKAWLYLTQNAELTSFLTGASDPVGCITVTGVWRHSGEWKNTGATISAGLNDSATTIAASSVANLEQDMVIRLDTEYCLITGISGTTLTLERAYNGSTAAAHLSGITVYRFKPNEAAKMAVKGMVQWWAEARKSPMFGNVVIGDFSYAMLPESFPKHVMAIIRSAKLRRTAQVRAG